MKLFKLLGFSAVILLQACATDTSVTAEAIINQEKIVVVEQRVINPIPPTNKLASTEIESVDTEEIPAKKEEKEVISTKEKEKEKKKETKEKAEAEAAAKKKSEERAAARRAKRAKERAEAKKKAKEKKAGIKFDEDVHEFGTIKPGDIIDHKYYFTNTGKADLVITNADVTCGCTTPSYPFIPIAPGERGFIGVTYNSTGKLGKQRPTVTLKTNAGTKKIYMNGYVFSERAKDPAKEGGK